MPNAIDNVGLVVSLSRYPVKSMLGEELNAAPLTESGLFGDRAFGLFDAADDKLVSAKQPRKWPVMFDCRATYSAPPRLDAPLPAVWITLPNGDVVRSDDTRVDSVLSSALGRDVRLRLATERKLTVEYVEDPLETGASVTDFSAALSAPSGTLFDYAPLHVLTTATLDQLRTVYPAGRFELRRFRPNVAIQVTSGETGFVENRWIGHTLAIGDEVLIRAVDPCPRCVMTTLPQGDLPRDLGILRAAAEYNRPHVSFAGAPQPSVGIYATVLHGGTIRRGDRVSVVN